MKTLKFFAMLLAFCCVFVFTGCASIKATDAVVPKPAATSTPTPTPVANPFVKPFGGTVTYQDGVTLSVAAPVAYTPTANAYGAVDGQAVVKMTVTITNGSKDVLDVAGFPQANSGSAQAQVVTDLEVPVGNTPNGPLLAGQSLSWDEAYSVTNPNDITFSYAPSPTYQTAIFTSQDKS